MSPYAPYVVLAFALLHLAFWLTVFWVYQRFSHHP